MENLPTIPNVIQKIPRPKLWFNVKSRALTTIKIEMESAGAAWAENIKITYKKYKTNETAKLMENITMPFATVIRVLKILDSILNLIWRDVYVETGP